MSTAPADKEIDTIRTASRLIVRELGFMNKQLAGTDLSPSAVHAILEIGLGSVTTAHELGRLLKLEKSSISRLVAGLVKRELIATCVDAEDSRARLLTLTKAGRAQFADIERFGQAQVRGALSGLPQRDRKAIAKGLSGYAAALQRQTQEGPQTPDPRKLAASVQIEEGYVATLLARVVGMHANYYATHYDFGAVFERKVAVEMAEFLGRLDCPKNLVLSAHVNSEIVGSVTIDGQDLGDNIAHLRWFILDDTARGLGLGNKLLSRALRHVDDHDFKATHLWTFKGLDAARHLYEKAGFTLAEESPGSQWGTEVTEQLFIRS